MHTTTTSYKGFAITTESHDGIGTVRFRFYVTGANFNPNGYPTMNHAKGAITKGINEAQKIRATMAEAVTTVAVRKAKAATSDDKAHASINVSANEANLLAALRYHGFLNADGTPKHTDSRSRNEREGTPAKRIARNKRDKLASTRQQRKKAERERKAFRAYLNEHVQGNDA